MTMEPTKSPSLEPVVNSAEDLTSSESIINVEKEELLDEAAAKESEESDLVLSECSTEITKVELPEELAKSVVILRCESTVEGGSCDVYLIGTDHISKQSCVEVEAVISFLKPEVVFLELCSSRVSNLTCQTLEIPTIWDKIKMWRQNGNLFGILTGWVFAKKASYLEVVPGSEFRVAYEEAIKYGGKVILGDRPIRITMKRTWAKMPLWHKIKYIFSQLYLLVLLHIACLFNTKISNDMLNQYFSKEYPAYMDTVVHERDQYMAYALLRVANEHRSVVAVIGKAHVNGIKKNWKQPIKMQDLMEIPSDKSLFTMKRIMAIAIVGTCIVLGILLARRR